MLVNEFDLDLIYNDMFIINRFMKPNSYKENWFLKRDKILNDYVEYIKWKLNTKEKGFINVSQVFTIVIK